jgi:hypothetical protein
MPVEAVGVLVQEVKIIKEAVWVLVGDARVLL